MIERDFILRQVAQLAQVLAAVLAGKRGGNSEGAQAALADGLRQSVGLDLREVWAMSRAEIKALVTEDGLVSAEKAVALADLLREDDHLAGQVRARWLYEVALRVGGPVPFDVAARISSLPEGEA